MPNESKDASVQQFKQADKPSLSEVPALDASLVTLARSGGFDFLEAVVDGVDSLNPVRKAKKNIFLTDSSKKEQRAQLKKKLNLWIDLIAENNSIAEMADKAIQKADISEALLKGNLKKTLDTTRQLEESYRSIHLFYKNTESVKLKNVSIMNAPMSELVNLDDPKYISHVAAELKTNFDRLDMRHNYSLMVIPGYLKSNKVLDTWAKMAYNNKVMLITDFENVESPDDLLEMFNDANLTGGDPHKANVMMTCNYIVGRGKKRKLEKQKMFMCPALLRWRAKCIVLKCRSPLQVKLMVL